MNPKKVLQNIWQNAFIATWQKVDDQKLDEQKGGTTKEQVFDRATISVFIITALCLILAEYVSSFKGLMKFLENTQGKAFTQGIWDWYHSQVNPKWVSTMYWVTLTITAYLIIPLVLIKWRLKKRWADFGWKMRATRQDLKLYAACFVVMLPLVMLVSSSKMFLAKYPFYQPKSQPTWLYYFLIWELMYLIQFIAVEFFFRGFLLHGIKRQLGVYSIWVAMIPYCMIHFQKPMPETIGAIIAGLVLGTFSLKNNSIWLGVLLHYSVAITMDLLALWHKGFI